MADPFSGTGYYAFKSQESAKKWEEQFRNFWRPIGPHCDARRNQGQARVAVLDTGIDEVVLTKHKETIRGRKCFLSYTKTGGAVDSDGSDDDDDDDDGDVPDQDPTRHGSHIVELILRLAPCAHIYVARVKKDQTSPMDPNGVAKAIRYAVEQWGVHIISMSWGFEQRHEPIAHAIQDAFKRKTIMFAAASNLGANGPKGYGVTFPAWMPEVICVNASDGYGKYSSFNPEPRPGSFNFLTLGEAVLAAQRSGGGGDGPAKPESRLTGTSFSTPVAAAMAALFIEFVMQKPLRRDIKLREEVVTRDGIIKLFAGMSEDKVQGFRYLRPWRLIHCEARSDGHDCKTCRTHAAERVKELLSGPLPVADDSARVPDLPHAPEAELESQINEGMDVCLPETRVELLEDIQTWVDDPKGKLLWWLTGKTGTGKSTLARTVAANLRAKQQLSACFFFSRNHRSCHDASTFVTSIAYQLGKASPVLAKAMSAAIAKDGDLAKLEKGRSIQWEKLVLEPLSFLSTGTGPQRVVVVVDALDECNEVRDIISVLQLLGKADRPDIGLRVLLTSRPERPIEEEFGDGKGLFSKSYRFDLGEIPRPTVDRDISTLIRHDMDRLKARLGVYGLPSDYLDGPLVERLTQKSDGLFIYAKVACGYIDGGDHPGQQQSTTPKQRLDLVLTDEGFKDLDSLYAKILERAVSGDDESLLTKQLRHVLEALVAMFEPTPETAFRKLCPGGLDPVLVNARLGSLQSVLMARDKPVQVFHESFRTFLLRKADRRFLIDEKEAHRSLFGTNLAHLSDVQNPALKRDMFNLARPGVMMDEIELHRAERDGCVSAETRYACRYWVDHLDLLDIPDRAAVGLVDDGPVHAFLQRHLLHWIEVLSLIKSLPKGLAMMEKLAGHAEATTETAGGILALVRDAYRFTRSHMFIIENAPLQLYASALLFSPAKSVVRSVSDHELWPFVRMGPIMPDDWDPWLQTLEGHDDDISMVGFSPDGRLLALADKSRIQLWDPVTGACKQTLNGAERCERFVFSPDGRQLASWGRAYWIVLWDPLSGARTQALESKQASETDTVAFSPCSRWLAAVCYHAVRVWDAATGELTQEMYTGRGFDVLSLAFSPDGRWLVFPHHSEVVVWDLETRALAHTLKGHYQIVRFVAFSADGRLASSDRWMSIRFWDPITGACISSTKPNGSPSFIAFSPNSRWLMAFGNMFGNMTTQLWDPETGDCAQTLEHGVVMSAAFSADSRWVASAGASGTIRLWDPATGACVRELKAHNGKAMSVAFSPNGRWLASGGDRVVRICDPTLPNPQTHDGHCETNSVAAASSAGGASGMAPDRDVLEPTVEPQVGTHEEISWGKAMAAFVRQHPWTPEGPTVKPRVEESNDSSMVEAVEAVKTVAFSPDGRWLASFTPGTVKIWDPATGAQRHTLKGREGEMESVRYSPDSRWLASFGSYDHDPEIGLWDLATGTRVQTLRGHSTRIESVVFSDDNSRVASFGVREWGLGLIRLWDPATGECTRTLEGHRVGVRSVKFSPDSRWLWSVGADRNDKRLRLWDAATGVRRRTLWARYGDDPDAFSSNGHWLVSAHANRSGAKRTVGLWGPTLESTRRQYDGRILWLKGQDSFNELALSADGRWLAVSGPGNGQIQLWRAGRGEYLHIRTLQGVSYSKWELVVFSPDGRRLATAGRTLASTDPGIQLWDTETGKCVHKIKQHSHIASIAFSPDGRLLASAGTELNFTVRLWDPATGVCTQTIDDIHTAAFSPDGRWFAVGRCRRSRTGPVIIQLWDSTIGTYTQTLKGHGVHGCMAFSPDSRWLASVGRGVIQIWNPATGACRWTFKDPRRVTLVGFSPNNQWLVASDVESLRLWDLCTGAYDTIYQPDPKYGRYYRPHQNVGSVAFSLDGRWLVWATDPDYCNGSIRLYQLAKKRYGEDRTFETGGRIVSLEFSPDSSLFAAAVETTVQLWNPAAVGKAARVRALECGRLVKAATFSPDGRQLAAADECSTIWLWDVSTGACLRTVEVDGRHTPTAIMFSPDGSHLALFGKVGWLWSLETGACTRAFQGHADVKAVAFSPTNKWLASFGIDEFDRTIQLWDPVTGSCVRTLEGHRNVGSVVFSPTSSALLASAGRDTVRLWDLARDGDACIQSLEDQHWASVAFSPCGDWLVSASISSFRLVDLKTGVCTHELQGIGHSPDVLESIGFSPDGQWLVSGSGRWIRLQGRAADAIQEPRDEPACQDHKLGIRDAWIVRGEEHMLWLPAEYRPSCWAVAGSKVAMGCPSGRVLILDIDNRRADL